MTNDFDYGGYSEEKINRYCDSRYLFSGISRIPYSITEFYSTGRCLREYTGWPSYLPIYLYSQHGAGYRYKVMPHEINNSAAGMLVFSNDGLMNYRRSSDKPCYLVTHPFVLYRKRSKIKQSVEAKGTLALPSHSSMDVIANYDIDKYVNDLNALPSEFQPVCVSLHISDIRRGQHLEYIKRGMPVYTAGHPQDIRYVERFYAILRNFKYTTSNHVGSYAYYSVEMGLPFSFYGGKAMFFNFGNKYLPKGNVDLADTNVYGEAEDVFSGLNMVISDRQRLFAHKALGIGEGLSGLELYEVFKSAFRERGSWFRDLSWSVRARIKSVLKLPVGRSQYEKMPG